MEKDYYANSIEHLVAELARIDLLIQTHVRKARRLHERDSQFRGLYITDQEIDDLLSRPSGLPHWATLPDSGAETAIRAAIGQQQKQIESLKEKSLRRGIHLRLETLAETFQLTPFEIDIVLICLAPEIDLRYERLYAYLHDDVTKRKPSVDLVLNLLSPSFEAKLAARRYLSADAKLLEWHLIHFIEDPAQPLPPLLARGLKISDRIVSYLHGADDIDPVLESYSHRTIPGLPWKDLFLNPEIKRRLARLVTAKAPAGRQSILYFKGPYGVSRHAAAEALCHRLGIHLLTVNLAKLLESEASLFENEIRLAGCEALLQKAALYFSHFDVLLSNENRFHLDHFLSEIETRQELTFLAGNTTWEPADALHKTPFVRIDFPSPVHADRVKLWNRSLNGDATMASDVNLKALANKFSLTGGQIKDAAATAVNLARWRNPNDVKVAMSDLHTASRLQSNRKLSSLAQKVTPHYRWDDIVLPDDCLQQLQAICNYVKYRTLVYDNWGFGRKLSLGKGLNALFAGVSGTGKTMAAEIIAAEIGLDLYKIDLSGVVSKYIGETEKNLARIFAEAETSNAILFFDEADALFGQRSEVRDSHDRYANIEISYLLQKMEAYEGIVILATNLRKNMDDAFVRRMHFTIEFPFPTQDYRKRIWEKIWPDEIPRAKDIDLNLLAKRFEIAGGNIKNSALAAAFIAAEDGKVVTMGHLRRSIQREYQKMGKVTSENAFGNQRAG